MIEAIVADQYTATRAYFASVIGVFVVESAIRLSHYLYQRYNASKFFTLTPDQRKFKSQQYQNDDLDLVFIIGNSLCYATNS